MLPNLVQKSVISYLIYTRGISFLNNVKKKNDPNLFRFEPGTILRL